ncbi:MAG: ribbon-helix-helix protein, CopG family, partial [Promethearchaeota archaeon]
READSLDHIARRLGWSRGQLLRELFQRFIETHRQPVKELQDND